MNCKFLLLFCPLAFMARVEAAPIQLARDKQAVATIVLPPNAPAPLPKAAADIQYYTRKIVGVELPVVTDGKTVAGAGLYLGQVEASRPDDAPDAKLNPESYAIRVRDGNIFFAARYPTPISFAVTSWIENNLGVRWFTPGPDWEWVVSTKSGELTVETKDLVSVPDTSPRIWSGHEWNAEWKDWNRRNKTVVSEIVPRRQFQNVLHKIFPPSKYAQSHPEYYPLVNGKRYIPASDTESYWRPDESNPEVVRLTVEYIRKYFDDNPTADSFSLSMDDIVYFDASPASRAMDARPDDYEKRRFSDRHYKFVTAVAREIKKTHPDRFIGTLIYNVAREIPTTVPKLEDNVFGWLTEESAQWYRPDIKAADQKLTRDWRSRVQHLWKLRGFAAGIIAGINHPAAPFRNRSAG